MKSQSMERTYLIIYMYFYLFSEVLGEVGITESKVDPFALILGNQKQLMEAVDKIAKKMETVNTIESKLYTLTSFVVSLSNKLENMQKNVNSMERVLDDISQEIYLIKNVNLLNISSALKEKSIANDCNEIIEAVLDKIPSNDCNSTSNVEKFGIFSEKSIQDEVFPMDQDLNYKEDNSNEVLTVKENISHSNDDKVIISAVSNVINSRFNTTRDQLIRMLSLLHSIEYRQHVSTITQDRRLNLLMHKMAFHQGLLEERLSERIKEEFKVTREELQGKIGAIEGRFSNQDDLTSFLIEMASNFSSRQSDNLSKNVLPLQGDINFSQENENFLPNLEEMDYATINYESLNNTSTPKSFDLKEIDVTHKPNNDVTPNKSNSIENISKIGQFLGYQIPAISATSSENESPKKEVNSFKNSLFKGHLHFIPDYASHSQQVSVADQKPLGADDSIKNSSSDVDDKILNMGNALIKRMGALEDMITGVRIHQTSSIYSYTKEIRYEMEKLESGISETIRAVGTKVSKKLEGARKALFTFIDAAVTSVSSAAVASAHSSSKHMAIELRSAVKELTEKVAKQNHLNYSSIKVCPEMYHQVGSSCYFLPKNVQTTWMTGCKICQALGGELALEPNKSYLEKLSNLLDSNISGLWLQNIRNKFENSKCDVIEEERNEELTNSLGGDESIEKRYEISNCRALLLTNLTIGSTSCFSKLGIICQHKPSNDFIKKTIEGINVNSSEIVLIT